MPIFVPRRSPFYWMRLPGLPSRSTGIRNSAPTTAGQLYAKAKAKRVRAERLVLIARETLIHAQIAEEKAKRAFDADEQERAARVAASRSKLR